MISPVRFEREIEVPGDPPVRLRIHRPDEPASAVPCIVSMHGGGYSAGTCQDDDALLDAWCQALGVVCVSVDYRLAPHVRYPGPLMDCYTALTWLHAHAAGQGIDPHRIGVHGTEAGGGLAAGLALVARDHRDVPLSFQVLVRPLLDDRESSAPGWAEYLGELFTGDGVPIYAAAGRCRNLSGLPPTYLSAAAPGDEGTAYAARLADAGVPVQLDLAESDTTSWLAHRIQVLDEQETA